MRRAACLLAAAGAFLAGATPAFATIYRVGPERSFTNLQDVIPRLEPGDTVELDGGAIYQGGFRFVTSGTPDAKITIRGVRSGGARPVLLGGEYLLDLHANHYVLEGLELTGASFACLFIAGHDVTIRDTVIHDCWGHGVLSSDSESGSQTFQYVEVHDSGSGETRHQMYIATDEVAHPGAVLRMEHCYVHDGNGGNNVKSRAERNEIYHNWIEGAAYHELDLIGPDGGDEVLAREDSDVVGNVLVKTSSWNAARLGGDGSGQTWGRYRFVNNTFVLDASTSTAIFLQDGLESLEAHNNVFFQVGAENAAVVKDTSALWATGAAMVIGTNNWVQQGLTSVPETLVNTASGGDPRFTDVGALDLRLEDGSPLIDRGDDDPVGLPGFEITSPLRVPLYMPPPRALERVGYAVPRRAQGAVDLGSFEHGSPWLAPERPELTTGGLEGRVACSAARGSSAGSPLFACVVLLGLAALGRRARRA